MRRDWLRVNFNEKYNNFSILPFGQRWPNGNVKSLAITSWSAAGKADAVRGARLRLLNDRFRPPGPAAPLLARSCSVASATADGGRRAQPGLQKKEGGGIMGPRFGCIFMITGYVSCFLEGKREDYESWCVPFSKPMQISVKSLCPTDSSWGRRRKEEEKKKKRRRRK